MIVMDEIEFATQSFIVKVWVEERAKKGSRDVWRGHITHVPDNRRRYLKSLDEIGDYIAPYLDAMGVEPGMRWRFRHWFRQMTR
jgi:hypothetical protein